MNCYDMLQWVRDKLGESTASHWSDIEILRELNKAQRKYDMILMQEPGDWTMTYEDLIPVDSVVTLPTRCSKVAYIEDSNEIEIQLSNTVRERNRTRLTGSGYESYGLTAYLRGKYLVINQSSYTSTVRVWYYERVIDMAYGTGGSSSGASALQFEVGMSPNRNDDYYNGATVEITGGTGIGIISEITDYNGSTMVATITGTAGSDSTYGTVSSLPEESHDIMVLEATVNCLAKPSSALDPKYFQFFSAELNKATKLFEEFISDRHAGSNRIRLT